MAAPDSAMKKKMLTLTLVLLIICMGVLTGRLFYIQIIKNDEYSKQATRQQLREIEISADRGTVYDRNGNVLAQSATAWTVVISPVNIKESQRDTIADGLSEITGVSRDFIYEATQRETAYAIIKKKVDRSTFEAVVDFADDLNSGAIYCEEDSKRYYPYGNLASAIIGFTGYENNGAYGLEAYYDRTLSGVPGKMVSAKNAWGLDMPTSYEKLFEAQDGNSVKLTIDQKIQAIIKRNIDLAVKEHKVGQGAIAIVYSVKTGEILGMESSGGFDPNSPLEIVDPEIQEILAGLTGEEYKEALGDAQYEQWRNSVISDPYEPGSVFKILVAAAALEENAINKNFTYNCTGTPISVSGQKYDCWKYGGHGDQSLVKCIMNSCNPAFIEIGQRLGVTKFREYFKAFGLMELTGVDLPGEAMSLYHSDSAFKTVELASSSIGQSFKVTPIQLIAAVSAAVGNGNLYEPYIVSEIIDSNGNVIERNEPKLKRQVVSETTANTVALMCEQVVAGSGGSGKNSYIPGYRIGGKTGTAEKLDSTSGKYVLSFLGFAPANDPEIAVLVALNEPEETSYGSVIAAPVVGAIFEEILPYLGYEKEFTKEELDKTTVKVPDVVGTLTHDGQSTIRRNYLNTKILGEGTTILKQTPEAGEKVDKDTTVILYTDEESLNND